MAWMRSATLVKDPRRMRFRVISANQRSTRLSQEELVGIKCQIEARMFLYPAFNAGMLMGCVIVDDEVQVEPRRGLTIYLAQEFEELFMAMAIETFSDNGSLKHVERCEKRRRAVANIVVSHGSATPALEGQSGLGAIQSLDL